MSGCESEYMGISVFLSILSVYAYVFMCMCESKFVIVCMSRGFECMFKFVYETVHICM